MTMTHPLRRFVLTAHITFSVGWLGAVANFLALGIAGLTSQNTQIVRASYLALELMAWFVILPLSVASLLTGLVQALGTRWGLFRHYWILVKFTLVVLSLIVLLIHMQPIAFMAGIAGEGTAFTADFSGAQVQLVAAPGVSLLVLLVVTTLAVYKPRGMTKYGWRKRQEQRSN